MEKRKFNQERRADRREAFDRLSREEGKTIYGLAHYTTYEEPYKIVYKFKSTASMYNYMKSWEKSALIDENGKLTEEGMNAREIYRQVIESPIYLHEDELLPIHEKTYNAGLIDIIPLGIGNDGKKEMIISKDEVELVPEFRSMFCDQNVVTVAAFCALGVTLAVPLAGLVDGFLRGFFSEI